MTLRQRLALLVATLGVPLSLYLLPTPAAAVPSPSPSTTQQLVETYLAAHPGGRQISPTELSYDGGRAVVSVARGGAATAAADCPSGWFCVYDGSGFSSTRLALSSCAWVDLAWYGWSDKTNSVHNAASGYVVFYNHGSGTTHNYDYAIFSINAKSSDDSVSPYLNVADHAKLFCP